MVRDAQARRGRPPSVDRATAIAATVKVLREEGAAGVTVRRVAEVLGVSRQVVYTLFGSLAGLVDELYRTGFERLRAAGPDLHADVVGAERVVAHALAYRRFALANPELYSVMFERPFRSYSPPHDSRMVALSAFDPFVDVVVTCAPTPEDAHDLSMTLWAAMHGVVHLELQGYLSVGASTELRLVSLVRATLLGGG